MLVQRGQIWFAEFSKGVGSEQKFSRPVVVSQNNIGNKFSPTVTVIPLSTQSKRSLPTHVELTNTTCLEYLSYALAEQITTIDKVRFTRYIGEVDQYDMLNINKAILIQNGLVG